MKGTTFKDTTRLRVAGLAEYVFGGNLTDL